MSRRLFTFRYKALVVLSVLAVFVSCECNAARSGIPRMNWSAANYDKVNAWLDALENERPESLLVLTDCDNTAWAGDIADVVFKVAVKKGIVTWNNAPVLQESPLPQDKSKDNFSPFDYYEYLYKINPLASYNYASLAFSNLTLADTYRAFMLATKDEEFPRVYEEMKALLNYLAKRGVAVGFVSASPIFMTAPMVFHAGYKAELWEIEGLDVYVENPKKGESAVLLSNLLQTSGIKKWSQAVSKFGRLKILPMASEIINSREGKAVGGLSIAARHVANWNKSKKEPLRFSDMRLAAVFGDNYGPFSDVAQGNPNEIGNDQGMVRALPFLTKNGLIVNIYRASERNGSLDLSEKRKYEKNYLEMVQQIKSQYPEEEFLTQVGVYRGEKRGHFDALQVVN